MYDKLQQLMHAIARFGNTNNLSQEVKFGVNLLVVILVIILSISSSNLSQNVWFERLLDLMLLWLILQSICIICAPTPPNNPKMNPQNARSALRFNAIQCLLFFTHTTFLRFVFPLAANNAEDWSAYHQKHHVVTGLLMGWSIHLILFLMALFLSRFFFRWRSKRAS